MKFELFPFQAKAVRRLRTFLAVAQSTYRATAITQAISFTAPTGAGKTIMLASLVENVYRGDEKYPAQPNAIFVWLSDSPELNRQSCDKFYFRADEINHGQLVMIEDDGFDQQTLDDGKIYFLNTQKLGKGSNLTKHSDFRQYTIWETLQNTVKEKSDKIYFIIDEAHRGMKGRAAGRATTIMQKFIKGSAEDNFDAVPLVIGMSATPERFNILVVASSATIHQVVVTNEEVKASGLLKEKIIVIYPDEQTSTSVAKDMTILEAAADEWKSKCEHWRQYITEQHDKTFNPIFVVQVENGTNNQISATNLDECLKKICQRTGITFEVGEVVHTFGQTQSDLTINNLRVLYCEPSRISGNDKIRVVFFKENLSTGWDCPQAETMMSFRHAVDATYIAQLLGRMIRTPLQRRIEVDDTLNEVRLYLPYFDQNSVQEILTAFRKSEDGAITTEIIDERLGDKKIVTLTVKGVGKILSTNFENSSSTLPTLSDENFPVVEPQPVAALELTSISDPVETTGFVAKKAEPVKVAFDRAEIVNAINSMALLTYKVRSEKNNDYLQSLFKLAHFLMRSALSVTEFDSTLDEVAAFIRNYIDKLKGSGEYESLSRQAKEFKLSAQIFDAFGESVIQAVSQNLFVTTDSDIDRQFRQAEARLKKAGVANRYLINFADDIDDGKIDVILFSGNPVCLEQLENFAERRFHKLCDKFRRKTVSLPLKLKDEYDDIVSDSDIISKHNFSLPESISMTHDASGRIYSDHLFVEETTGTATIELNTWEETVLREEQQRKDFVCWLRNPPRKQWSLCLPRLDEQNNCREFYPDFLVVRRNDNGYIVDILEPHNPDFRDYLSKAKSLAEYAEQKSAVERIQMIHVKTIRGQDISIRLDMSEDTICDRVRHATNNVELDNIFDEYGILG